jgi:16S rRNA processing protein RimM
MPFGYVLSAHGLRGEVLVVSHRVGDTLPEKLSHLRLAHGENAERDVTLKTFRSVPKGYLLLIDGVNSRDAALEYRGTSVWIPKQSLAPLGDGEFYMQELLGCDAFDEEGVFLGKSERFLGGTGQSVVVLAYKMGERLYPLADDAVLHFDRHANKIILRRIEGLWE